MLVVSILPSGPCRRTFTRPARFVLGGRLMGRGSEMLIAAPAFAAFGHTKSFAGDGEIVKAFAGGFVVDYGSDRDFEFDGFALVPSALAAHAVLAALGFVFGVKAELEQGIGVFAADHDDVTAAAAIAAAGPAARDELLPAEGKATVPAVPGLYENSYFVNEHLRVNMERPPA